MLKRYPGDTESDKQFIDSLEDLRDLMLTIYDRRLYLLHQTVREFLVHIFFELNKDQFSWQTGSISTFY